MAARLAHLDTWLPPPDSGRPLGALVTTRVIEELFFEQHCLPRFLSSADGRKGKAVAPYGIAVVAHDTIDYPAPARGRSWTGCALTTSEPSLHANASLLLWEKRGRLVVSSASITETSYREHLQSYDYIDFEMDGAGCGHVVTRSLGFLSYVLSNIENRQAGGGTPMLDGLLEWTRSIGRRRDESESCEEAVPIFLGLEDRSLVAQMMELWGAPTKPRELYIETARTPSIEELISIADECSLGISAKQMLKISLVSTEPQRLGEPRALRSLLQRRYSGKIILGLYEPKLLEGVQLAGNTLILSDDDWLLRVVGSTCQLGQGTTGELHAVMARSIDCSRNPRLEEQVLSALVEVSTAC